MDRRLLSIDASGLFTAYSDSGLYHVIAEVPGLADTAMVTIAAAGQRRSWTEPVAKGAFFACKALGTFWRLNACGELLRDLKGLVTRRRRIGFDPTLLRFILVVLAVASAAALHTRRHPPDLSVLPPGWGRGRIQGPPQVAPS